MILPFERIGFYISLLIYLVLIVESSVFNKVDHIYLDNQFRIVTILGLLLLINNTTKK
jgi:hypothetical protein